MVRSSGQPENGNSCRITSGRATAAALLDVVHREPALCSQLRVDLIEINRRRKVVPCVAAPNRRTSARAQSGGNRCFRARRRKFFWRPIADRFRSGFGNTGLSNAGPGCIAAATKNSASAVRFTAVSFRRLANWRHADHRRPGKHRAVAAHGSDLRRSGR